MVALDVEEQLQPGRWQAVSARGEAMTDDLSSAMMNAAVNSIVSPTIVTAGVALLATWLSRGASAPPHRATLFAPVLICAILPIAADVPIAAERAPRQDASQSPREQAPLSFDVASIKPNKTGARLISIETYPGGRFVATNVPLRSLVRLAYGLEDHQIVGGPSWINTDPFDIIANAGRELPQMNGPFGAGGALPDMLKSLLADRFGLVAHAEMRELPVFHLVMAREDRRLGDDLKRSTMDCAALFAQRKPEDGNPPCGVRLAPGSIVLEGTPISQLASALTGSLGRAVIDRTTLEGTYDLQLHWRMRPPAAPDAPPPAAPEGPTLFTALQDQAGLRLENTRGPRQVLVIESVEQPTPN